MDPPERDGIDVLFIIAKVAGLHVAFGLIVCLVSIYPLVALLAPHTVPMGFHYGLASGIPFAYVMLRVSSSGRTFNAGNSFTVGILFIACAEFLGFWSWFALTSMGVGVFAPSYVTGLAVASGLPFFTITLRTLGKRAFLRNPDSRD